MVNQNETPSDTLTFTDILSKNINKFLNEGINIIENVEKSIQKSISDNIVFSDVTNVDVGSMLLEQTRTIRPQANTNINAEGALISL